MEFSATSLIYILLSGTCLLVNGQDTMLCGDSGIVCDLSVECCVRGINYNTTLGQNTYGYFCGMSEVEGMPCSNNLVDDYGLKDGVYTFNFCPCQRNLTCEMSPDDPQSMVCTAPPQQQENPTNNLNSLLQSLLNFINTILQSVLSGLTSCLG